MPGRFPVVGTVSHEALLCPSLQCKKVSIQATIRKPSGNNSSSLFNMAKKVRAYPLLCALLLLHATDFCAQQIATEKMIRESQLPVARRLLPIR